MALHIYPNLAIIYRFVIKNKESFSLLFIGLTCTEQNFTTKAGAQRVAAELGIMLVMPDTSPSKHICFMINFCGHL